MMDFVGSKKKTSFGFKRSLIVASGELCRLGVWQL
jgi:hypothetical protein